MVDSRRGRKPETYIGTDLTAAPVTGAAPKDPPRPAGLLDKFTKVGDNLYEAKEDVVATIPGPGGGSPLSLLVASAGTVLSEEAIAARMPQQYETK